MNTGDEPPLLTFQWRDRDHPVLRLVLYAIISFGCATGFFLLFKVVYPQPRHFSTAPQQLLVLDPNQSSTRDILNRTTDDNFLLLSPESDPATVSGSTRELFPVFRPSFAGFEMKLVDLPGEEDERTLPRIFSIQDMPLPPSPTVMKAQDVVEKKSSPSVLRIRLHGDLAGREILNAPDLKNVTLADASPPRFQLSVNRSGRVTFALPIDSSADVKQMRQLQKVVSGLRFKAATADGVQWGEATFAWEAAAKR